MRWNLVFRIGYLPIAAFILTVYVRLCYLFAALKTRGRQFRQKKLSALCVASDEKWNCVCIMAKTIGQAPGPKAA